MASTADGEGLMYRDAVKYKDSWLAPGSECLELYKAKKWKELDALMAKTDAAWRKLEGRDK
ncbi:hypothetical protein QGX12_gp021 [Pseudomonas phage Kremar]|uniref:Uncharacterized protein n=1 Tax=Pseudomonas phage Kremar TaxID=2928831 RepID=A0AAE9GNC0_9CAUD|nr:hypothetical protein QGX12_gp021 [Pseudomonas phage Kremar]UOL48444.1 hypothetical protein [Pseudomonas phage Kremar]